MKNEKIRAPYRVKVKILKTKKRVRKIEKTTRCRLVITVVVGQLAGPPES